MKLESAQKVLGNLEDFKSEKSALEELVHSRGHILLMSPKGHPELAGKGVEYAWGAAKLLFRKINDCKVKNLHINILRVMDTDYLTLERCRKFARKARDYRNAYEYCNVGLEEVERMKKHSKAHRCTMHQDMGFLMRTLDIDIPQTGAAARTAVRSTQATLDRRDRAAEAPTYR
eukprot:jgi/Tetstr1/448104/TSEL_035402.t1